ncbi:MAG: DNA polymerase III subunit gamma/tau [Bdellovibrionales bacterium]|nr:DNA polymerase III subunit gamma/tau [Bdellovibrionales bacterium]
MSYQVIARKWRPKEFNEIIGQDHISQTLLNALKNNRLPHALLFTGPRGTGKTSSARVLAKSLRCPNAKDFIPCNQCSDCTEISSGSNVNVSEIDGASNNGVEAIRELRESVGYMPSSGVYKVYIIDEVHMLSTSAFNALLKTLEEPPEHVIFVLATTEAHKIPNTILSRCQRFDFRRIPTQKVTEHLKAICDAEGIQAHSDALWVIARQGEGSMRDSQSLLDQVITFSDGELTQDTVNQVLGLTDREVLLEVLEAIAHKKNDVLLASIEKIFTAGYDPKVFVQDLLETIRNLLLVKISTEESAPQIVDLPDGEIQALLKIGSSMSHEDIHLLFDMALKGGDDIPKSQSPHIVLEMILLRMLHAPKIASLGQFINASTNAAPIESKKNNSIEQPKDVVRQNKTLTNNSNGLSNTDNLPNYAAPANTLTEAAPSSLTKSTTGERSSSVKPTVEESTSSTTPTNQWHALVQKIKNVNPIVASQLENTYVKKLENNIITLAVPVKLGFIYEKLIDPQFQRKILNYLNTFWGPGYSLQIEKAHQKEESPQTPKALELEKKQKQQSEIQQQVEAHPVIQKTNELFKTEIMAIRKIQPSKNQALTSKEENS